MIENLKNENLCFECQQLRADWIKSDFEIEQILGAALGYPRYCDDQTNFPRATEADGVCTGDHVPVTLAVEAAEKIKALTSVNRK